MGQGSELDLSAPPGLREALQREDSNCNRGWTAAPVLEDSGSKCAALAPFTPTAIFYNG